MTKPSFVPPRLPYSLAPLTMRLIVSLLFSLLILTSIHAITEADYVFEEDFPYTEEEIAAHEEIVEESTPPRKAPRLVQRPSDTFDDMFYPLMEECLTKMHLGAASLITAFIDRPDTKIPLCLLEGLHAIYMIDEDLEDDEDDLEILDEIVQQYRLQEPLAVNELVHIGCRAIYGKNSELRTILLGLRRNTNNQQWFSVIQQLLKFVDLSKQYIAHLEKEKVPKTAWVLQVTHNLNNMREFVDFNMETKSMQKFSGKVLY